MFTKLSRATKSLVTTFAAVALLSVPVSSTFASPINGRVEDTDVLRGDQSVTYTLSFRGGEAAHVVAVGGGDIDIYVYDENGNLITKDTDADSRPIVLWTPKWTGKFKVKIVNTESCAVDYAMIAN